MSSVGSIECSNQIKLSSSINHRTHWKVPVRLCLIAKVIEQQSDQGVSFEFDWFWFGFIWLTKPGFPRDFFTLSTNREPVHRRKVKKGDSSEWPHNQIYFRLSARWVFVGVGGGGGGSVFTAYILHSYVSELIDYDKTIKLTSS